VLVGEVVGDGPEMLEAMAWTEVNAARWPRSSWIWTAADLVLLEEIFNLKEQLRAVR
jgi:hypothetical protein